MTAYLNGNLPQPAISTPQAAPTSAAQPGALPAQPDESTSLPFSALLAGGAALALIMLAAGLILWRKREH